MVPHRNQLAAALGDLQEVRPVLHHLGAWLQVESMVISGAHSIARSVGKLQFDVLVRMVNTVSFRVDATAVEFKHLHVSTHARVYLRELHIAFLLRNTLCRAYTKNNIANK